MVGEIRDHETAQVAVQAALTGHLVLSTLHTNDAAATVTRLLNMGVEPFLVMASLNTIVAQRLLRMVCPKCKVETQIPKAKLIELGFAPDRVGLIKPMKGTGCVTCANTGYEPCSAAPRSAYCCRSFSSESTGTGVGSTPRRIAR